MYTAPRGVARARKKKKRSEERASKGGTNASVPANSRCAERAARESDDGGPRVHETGPPREPEATPFFPPCDPLSSGCYWELRARRRLSYTKSARNRLGRDWVFLGLVGRLRRGGNGRRVFLWVLAKVVNDRR